MCFAHGFYLLGQSGICFQPGLFDFLQFRIDLDQRFFDRFDEFVDGGLAFLEVAFCRLVKYFQFFFGQLEERFVAVLQRVRCQGLERIGELFLGVVEKVDFFLRLAALVHKSGFHLTTPGV